MTESSVHRYGVRVGYIDTDQAKVVHHSSYFRWFEHARTEFLRARGLHYKIFEERDHLGLPVVEIKIRYLAPALFDDWLEIECWVAKLGRASVTFEYRVVRDDQILTKASTLLACARLDTGRPTSMPDALIEALRR